MSLLKTLLLLPFRLLFCLLKLIEKAMGLGWQKRVTTGEEYEAFVQYYLERQGYSRICHTGRTGDLGVDLVARRGGHTCAVQCKFYSGSVGGGAVQEVVAGMPVYHCDTALIVTNSTLTRGAWKLARLNDVEVLENISPETACSPQSLITPKNLVAFAVGCVLIGVVFSRLLPTVNLGPDGYCLLCLLCLLAAWCAVSLLKLALRLLFRP